MSKKKILLVVFILIPVLIFILRFVVGGNEDDWICVNNEWVKHGNPEAPKPEGVCGKTVDKNTDETNVCSSETGKQMDLEDAKKIAEMKCKDGKLKESYFCNPNSGSWWFDFNPDSPKEGCNPACVVFIDTQETEINWRCTGLIEPMN